MFGIAEMKFDTGLKTAILRQYRERLNTRYNQYEISEVLQYFPACLINIKKFHIITNCYNKLLRI